MKKLTKSEAGKLGANETWKDRYRILAELRELYGRAWRDHKFVGWKTEQLDELLKFHKKGKIL